MLCGGFLDLRIHQAGLSNRHTGDRVDRDLSHSLGADHDATVDGAGSTGKARAGTSGNHRNAVGGCPSHHGLDVFGARSANHGSWTAGGRVGGPVLAVAAVTSGSSRTAPSGSAATNSSRAEELAGVILSSCSTEFDDAPIRETTARVCRA